jgi:AcrR family transcriptional regulator
LNRSFICSTIQNRNMIPDTKEQWLDAAQLTFAKFGYKKTTLDDIAKGFGKGKTAIYHYFQGKDDIFLAVLNKEADALIEAVDSAVLNTNDPLEQLKMYVSTRIKSIYGTSVLIAAINNNQTHHLHEIPKVVAKLESHRHQLLCTILQNGIDQRIIKPMDVHLAATLMETAIKGLETVFLSEIEPTNIDQRIDNLLQLLLYGLVDRA